MQSGFMLLLAGMGTVFTFLILLVLCLQLSAIFFKAFGHRFADPVPQTPLVDEYEILAIAIAAADAACSTTGSRTSI